MTASAGINDLSNQIGYPDYKLILLSLMLAWCHLTLGVFEWGLNRNDYKLMLGATLKEISPEGNGGALLVEVHPSSKSCGQASLMGEIVRSPERGLGDGPVPAHGLKAH